MVHRTSTALLPCLLLVFIPLVAAIPVTIRQDVDINLGTPRPPAPVVAPQASHSPAPSQVIVPGTQPSNPIGISPRPPTNLPPSITPAAPTPATGDPNAAGTVGTNATPSPAPAAKGGGGLNTGAIIGIVFAVLLLLALIALLIWLVAKRSSDDGSPAAAGAAGSGGAGGAAYATPEAGTRSLAGAAAGGAAAGAAGKGGDGSIQDVNLAAEAEADTSGGAGDGYVVSDSARHHGAAPTGAVVAAAAGAGTAGAIFAASPRELQGAGAAPARAPSPPPHDYVVGVGKIETKSDFEDIKTRFARDEIEDKSAVLGGATHTIGDTPLEGATDAAIPAAAPVVIPSPVVSDIKNPVADLSEDRSGDVSEAARGLAVPEIIAEEAAETPLFERDELPK